MAPQREPFFLQIGPGALGQRFAIHHLPQRGDVRGLVVYVHPFAEEMNKSRRMAAMQSRALAAAGFAVLQMDLVGCGDSSGDFGDATWSQWVDDVVLACRWMQQRHAPVAGPGAPQLWLWGLRVGCLIAVEAARQLDCNCNFAFWQPAASGKLLLQQFLRLKLAGELVGGQSKSIMDSMRAKLSAGRAVEVAGYTLHPELCQGMEQATLGAPPRPGRIEWFEVSPRDDAGLSPVAAAVTTQWERAGWSVRTQRVNGPTFWQTTEIEDAPALLTATIDAIVMPESPGIPLASNAAVSA